MRESRIENNVRLFAVKNGWLVRKVKWLGRVGAPDRLFAKGGVVIFVEFKATGKDATETQVREHARMKEAGLHVIVIDSIEAGREIFR